MEIITVRYSNGIVLDNSDEELLTALKDGANVIHAIPILATQTSTKGIFVTTHSIQYLVEYPEVIKGYEIDGAKLMSTLKRTKRNG